ncbi:MAG: hypothetical protein SV375_18835 [Thermodesulfobacteriota bacterium]|nr:hypothetical protein [Thermodesulfobacteriota bacterium]
MTISPLDNAIRKTLNNRRVFWMPQKLIGKADWSILKLSIENGKTDDVQSILSKAKNGVIDSIKNESDPRKKVHLEDAKNLLDGLRTQIDQRSSIVTLLFDMLDEFGPLRNNLPDMENFGKVIEGHNRPTVEQFFLYKMQKEQDRKRKYALYALIEIVIELYESHVNPLEIAFFVRKIDSLSQIMEVLKCQKSKS